MSQQFSDMELIDLHKALWDSSRFEWHGLPITGPRDPMRGYRAFRRGTEAMLSQNMNKNSANTHVVRSQGFKISWVIDNTLGYLDKIVTDTQGNTTIEHLK